MASSRILAHAPGQTIAWVSHDSARRNGHLMCMHLRKIKNKKNKTLRTRVWKCIPFILLIQFKRNLLLHVHAHPHKSWLLLWPIDEMGAWPAKEAPKVENEYFVIVWENWARVGGGEWVNGWVGEWLIDWLIDWLSEWVSEWVSVRALRWESLRRGLVRWSARAPG